MGDKEDRDDGEAAQYFRLTCCKNVQDTPSSNRNWQYAKQMTGPPRVVTLVVCDFVHSCMLLDSFLRKGKT
jgi:hypothetical protein